MFFSFSRSLRGVYIVKRHKNKSFARGYLVPIMRWIIHQFTLNWWLTMMHFCCIVDSFAFSCFPLFAQAQQVLCKPKTWPGERVKDVLFVWWLQTNWRQNKTSEKNTVRVSSNISIIMVTLITILLWKRQCVCVCFWKCANVVHMQPRIKTKHLHTSNDHNVVHSGFLSVIHSLIRCRVSVSLHFGHSWMHFCVNVSLFSRV